MRNGSGRTNSFRNEFRAVVLPIARSPFPSSSGVRVTCLRTPTPRFDDRRTHSLQGAAAPRQRACGNEFRVVALSLSVLSSPLTRDCLPSPHVARFDNDRERSLGWPTLFGRRPTLSGTSPSGAFVRPPPVPGHDLLPVVELG